MKLLGFAVSVGLTGNRLSVSLPSRQYVVDGERRSFSLLRSSDNANAQQELQETAIATFSVHMAEQTSS